MRINSNAELLPSSRDVNLLAIDAKAIGQHEGNVTRESSSIGEKYFSELIEKTNKSLRSSNTHLKLSVHDQSHQIIVKVINTETDEVIREIPPEKFIDLVYNLCKQVGLVFDERG